MTQISLPNSLRQYITRTVCQRDLRIYYANDYARGWVYRRSFENLEDLIDRAHTLIVHTTYEEHKIRP